MDIAQKESLLREIKSLQNEVALLKFEKADIHNNNKMLHDNITGTKSVQNNKACVNCKHARYVNRVRTETFNNVSITENEIDFETLMCVKNPPCQDFEEGGLLLE